MKRAMFDLICPYCFGKFSKRRLVYRCPDDGQSFERIHFYEKEIRCPSCGSDATANACCPVCGSVIPIKARDAHFTSVAVVGAGLSGKTVYLTVALNELRNKVGFLAISPLTRDTSLWFNKNREDLFVNGQLLEATQPVREPLIWSVVNTRHRKRKLFSNHTITFLDTCGELTSTIDTLVAEYLKSCSSILFVVDPLMLRGAQKTVVDKNNDEDITASLAGSFYSKDENVTETIDAIARKIRDVRGIPNHKKLEIPLALVLTKMDLINPISTQKSDEMKDSQPSQTIDYEKGNPHSEEVKKWLRDIGEESLLSTVANNFSVYNFFPVSSLGSSPRRTYSTYTCDSIKPYGVLDPLWWIFKYNHIVD